ncbi:hypothetical protein FA95DRAFT_1537523 [Auriscalpium vulgare]|uniref:Uncharacterized protein n=1 Tax=Auriscalpium vulgare TaxID=40419 RepID=A0ACB8S1R5_9AGAM|nr:hypothetical protein FA95DRAFT_1537523 [Auriscalpium vulgare]
MCLEECFGNQYRGCGHYVRLYSTGVRTDCGSLTCVHSATHMHKTARQCTCSRAIYDNRRVINLFQEQCDDCKEVGYDRGRRR